MSRAQNIIDEVSKVGAGVGKGSVARKTRKEVLTRMLALTKAAIHDKYPGYEYKMDSDGQDLYITITFDEPFEPEATFGQRVGQTTRNIFAEQQRNGDLDIQFLRKYGGLHQIEIMALNFNGEQFKETVRKQNVIRHQSRYRQQYR